MKNKNYITKYLIIILPLLFINLNAQDQTDPLEKEATTEEATAGAEAKRKIAQELGLDDGASEEEASAEETGSAEAATEEVEVAEEADAVEELAVKEKLGFSFGVAPSIGFVSGETFTNVPTGLTIVITTPYGFKLGPLDFTLSAAFGSYKGLYDGEKAEPKKPGELKEFDPPVFGVGGNLTLASFVFAEGHAGIVGEGTGIRGFAGVSLEYLMKKGLGLPVNILVGGEGFISSDMAGVGNSSYWGGLGVRLDYDF